MGHYGQNEANFLKSHGDFTTKFDHSLHTYSLKTVKKGLSSRVQVGRRLFCLPCLSFFCGQARHGEAMGWSLTDQSQASRSKRWRTLDPQRWPYSTNSMRGQLGLKDSFTTISKGLNQSSVPVGTDRSKWRCLQSLFWGWCALTDRGPF